MWFFQLVEFSKPDDFLFGLMYRLPGVGFISAVENLPTEKAALKLTTALLVVSKNNGKLWWVNTLTSNGPTRQIKLIF